MAVNKKIVECTELTTAPAADDALPIVDISDTTDDPTGTSKFIEWLNAIKFLFGSRFAEDAGANDTYVATLAPAPAAYETGQHYRFKANTANTGACTVNFNALGAKAIKKAAGGITTDLADNDIRAGQWVDLVYDGTNMQMQSLLGNAPAGGSGGIGDVVGPASATDNALARFNTTTGKLIQNSVVTVDDDGAITVPEIAAPSTPAAGKVVIYAKSDNKVYRKGEDGVEAELGGGGGSIAPLTIVDANTVDQVNSTNAQSFRVYKTTTNNYRFAITNAGGAFQLRSESTSGTPDPVRLYSAHATKFYSFDMSNFLPPDDAVQNLGSLGQKWNLISGVDFYSTSAGSFRFGSSSTVVKSAGDGVLDVQTQNSNVGGTVRFVPRTGSAITADQNNYSSGGISKYQRWSSDASRNVTGFVTSPTQVTGQEHIITNVGSNPIVLVHESASSTAANRFTTNTGADITLGANEMAYVWYDGTSQRWRAAKL